jgi:hypothetical protein
MSFKTRESVAQNPSRRRAKPEKASLKADSPNFVAQSRQENLWINGSGEFRRSKPDFCRPKPESHSGTWLESSIEIKKFGF